MIRVNLEHDETFQAILASPIPGVPYLAIRTDRGELSAVEFVQQAVSVSRPLEPVMAQTISWLKSYFDGSCKPFVPVQPVYGTPFQHRVWQLLQQIPWGETRRYGELAMELRSSARAVAGACRANPLPIIIPCHRVVAVDGLGGYMGQSKGEGVVIKHWLLHHEGYV